ncbi:MAG: HIT domain-containing protein [Bacilli bacterium]|nr:HIT domain-containing protein [Bacilli bacterium]MDD4808973.1 HIT domain-containing protein [Bacilli bacterium]
MNCVFCKIMSGEIPSYTIYEDDLIKIFLDINPDTNGHLLIVPKKHILDLNEMDDSTLIHIMKMAQKHRLILEEKLKIDGLTLIQNNGMIQEVKHFHLHLKPYYKDKQPLKDPKEIYEILKSLD